MYIHVQVIDQRVFQCWCVWFSPSI